MNVFEKNLLSFPDQLSLGAVKFDDLQKLKGAKPDGVVFVGMGGSGMPGTILQNIATYVKIPVPIITWRDFGLPVTPFKNPLFIFISFSGNTREAISGLRLASRARLKAVITSGGVFKKEAEARNLPRATFPAGTLPPRQGTGLMLYGALGILKMIFPQCQAPDLTNKIKPLSLQKIGAAIAKKMKGKVTAVYTSSALSHVGEIIRINLAETGKSLAMANTFPEINHNELTAYEPKPKHVDVLFALGTHEAGPLAQEVGIIKKILTDEQIPVQTVTVPGATPLETTFNGIVLAQWIGYYLANLKKLDPMSLNTVNKIKKLIGQ